MLELCSCLWLIQCTTSRGRLRCCGFTFEEISCHPSLYTGYKSHQDQLHFHKTNTIFFVINCYFQLILFLKINQKIKSAKNWECFFFIGGRFFPMRSQSSTVWTMTCQTKSSHLPEKTARSQSWWQLLCQLFRPLCWQAESKRFDMLTCDSVRWVMDQPLLHDQGQAPSPCCFVTVKLHTSFNKLKLLCLI